MQPAAVPVKDGETGVRNDDACHGMFCGMRGRYRDRVLEIVTGR